MLKRAISRCCAAIILSTCSIYLAQAADGPYKVIGLRSSDPIEKELNALAKEGWVLRSVVTSNQCSDRRPDGSKISPECHIFILERKAPS